MPVSRKHRPYKLNSNRVPNLDRKLAEKSNQEVAREERTRLESIAHILHRSADQQSLAVHRDQMAEPYLNSINALRDALCSGGEEQTRVAPMIFEANQVHTRKDPQKSTAPPMYEISKLSDEELEKELARAEPPGDCSQREGRWKRLREKARWKEQPDRRDFKIATYRRWPTPIEPLVVTANEQDEA